MIYLKSFDSHATIPFQTNYIDKLGSLHKERERALNRSHALKKGGGVFKRLTRDSCMIYSRMSLYKNERRKGRKNST